MKRILLGLGILLLIGSVHAIQFTPATVKMILEEGTTDTLGITTPSQKILLRTRDNKTIRIDPGQYQIVLESQRLKKNDAVIVANSPGEQPRIVDRNRLPALGIVMLLFFVVAWLVGKKTAIRSLIGLGISLVILMGWLLPALLNGAPTLLFCVLAAIGITGITITVSHGWRRRTGLAVIATFFTLAIAFGLATMVVFGTQLFGIATEQAYYLVTGLSGNFDLRGLLLGSIVIGVVGVLDDVTTTQIAAIEEISRANPSLSQKELWQRGMSVGHEHVASMINTLALAYIGAGLPLFLLAASAETPLWVQLNSEFFATEIVRTVVGSCALILGVPISTAIAAWHWRHR